MDTLKTLLQPLTANSGMGHYGPYGGGSNGLIDGMKLVVLGGTVETARRISSGAWSHFINSFFLTAHFNEDEPPYDWLMLWLSRRPEWQRSREFETTTRISTPGGFKARGIGEFGDEDSEDSRPAAVEIDDVPGQPKTRVVFQPTFDTTHTIYWRGHWLRVKRSRRPDRYGYTDNETISISVVARNNNILKQLVLRAKREYEAEAITRIQIYFADQYGGWRWTDSRHKRPLSSIVLNPGVKEMLLNDAKDFLASEKWYLDRGIPFRRGYLLHGVPGSGKSSLIHALAGELMLDIYVVSLSSSWISDSTLSTLLGRVPTRCILLLEDLDAAFTRSLTRERQKKRERKKAKKDAKKAKAAGNADGDAVEGPSKPARRRNKDGEALSDQNTLTLSGLLNALDGVAASEGRLLFATTNHLTKLDPALSRPGRMDVWVEFQNATRWQAEALFRNFFPVEDEEDAEQELEKEGVEVNVESESLGPAKPDVKAKDAEDSRPSLFHRLSTPVSVFGDLLSGGSKGDPTQSVPQEETKPPALKYTSPTSSTSSLKPSTVASSKTAIDLTALPQFGAENEAFAPPPPSEDILTARHSAKALDKDMLSQLAKKYAEGLPEGEFSVASLQGYLLKHKSSPHEAAHGVTEWVITERETKAKLDKTRAEKDEKRKKRKEKAKAKAKKQKEKAKKEAADAAAAATAQPAASTSADSLPPPPPVPALPADSDATSPDGSVVLVEPPAPPPLPLLDSFPPPPPPAAAPLPPPPALVEVDSSDSDTSDDDSDADDDQSSDGDDEEDGDGDKSSDSDSSDDEK